MELKRLIINTKLLLDDIVDINKAAFMDIRADSEEVTNLWKEYGRLRNILIQSYPVLFNTLPEHSVPEACIARDDSIHFVGTLIFKPEHFSPLRQEVERILNTLKGLSKKQKKTPTTHKRKKYRA